MTLLNLRREDVFAPLEANFNKLFDKYFDSSGLQSLRNFGKSGYPKLDVLISDGRYIVEVAIPGIVQEDLKVEILPYKEDGAYGAERKLLKISGKMARDYQYSNATQYLLKELRRSFFERVLLLPDDLVGDPEAVIDNGMLRLTWQMPQLQKPSAAKLIEVKKV